jgi:protoheme IX farnesyltransferase
MNNRTHIQNNSLTNSWLKDLSLLIKMRLTITVVFSSLLAFVIAVDANNFSYTSLLLLSFGGFLITAAANILNQVLERSYDSKMKRTANRPLAAGRMKVTDAVLLAGIFSLLGIVSLALFNPLTSFLGTFALVSYAFIYTPIKRISPVAVAVGAIPGALPVLIGCVAAEGTLTFLGMSLFAFQFLWQFPHFWSIGWLGFDDYSNAGYKLMPTNIDGHIDRRIGFQSVLYVLFLFPVGIIPYYLGVSGWISLIVVSVMTVVYLFFAIRFKIKFNRQSAMALMFSSFFYVPVSFIALLLDKI